nr:reverse transcriptase domain-containing protein [Tanacetum cinerariifolium]
MLVQVSNFVFSIDFVIRQIEKGDKVPIVLGRPFLHTADAIIRVKNKELNLGVGDDIITFLTDKAMRHSHSNDDICFRMDVIDEVTEEELDALLDDSKPFSITSENISESSLDYEFEEFMAIEIKEIPEQCRLDPNIKEVVKKEIIKLLDVGIIYAIEDSPWVSPVHCVPKKGGMTVVTNEKNELVPTRTVTGWLVFIDYRKLNEATRKDHFPLRFMDQMLESKTLNNGQQNYTVIEKELLAVVFAFDKFRLYLVLSKTIVFTYHSALKYLFAKQDAKPHIIRWILLLQEFDNEIKNKKGTKNVTADHLSQLENPHLEELKDDDIDDNFPDETLMNVSSTEEDKILWFADFANYLVGKILRKGLTYAHHCKFFLELKHYFWDESYLFKMCPESMIRRCVYGAETQKILDECHHGPTGGRYGPSTTTKKVFDAGFYFPTIFKEAHTLV